MKIWRSTTRFRLANLENEVAWLHSQNPTLESAENLQLDPDFYIAFEDRFRGPSDIIKERVSIYLDDLSHLANSNETVADIGCGRGELLAVLRESGIRAIGVDNNPSSIASLQERGFEASCEDLLDFLKRTPDSSLAVITMLHVVEHLPFDLLLLTFQEVFRVLKPGGIFIAETPNSLNLNVGSSTFWIDPTHQKPLHPEVLRFLAGYFGFKDTEIRFLDGEMSTAYDVSMLTKKHH
jgi:SAM-dependent methyltransferase